MIPQRIKDGIDLYVTHGIQPGGFLRAVLENDLLRAVQRADAESLAALPVIVCYLYSNVRADCWGSRPAVAEWLAGAEERRAKSEALSQALASRDAALTESHARGAQRLADLLGDED